VREHNAWEKLARLCLCLFPCLCLCLCLCVFARARVRCFIPVVMCSACHQHVKMRKVNTIAVDSLLKQFYFPSLSLLP